MERLHALSQHRRRHLSDAGTDGATIGAVAHADDGTFAAVRGGWDVWYDKQRFYRGTDGLHWDTLPSGAYTPSKECSGS